MPIPIDYKTSFDDSALMRGLRTSEAMTQRTAKSMQEAFGLVQTSVGAIAGSAVVTGLSRAFGAITDRADQIVDLSEGLGLTTESFQRLSGVMQQSGVDGEKFASGIQKLNAQIDNAKDGNEQAIENFKRLGVSLAELRALDTETILLRIADGLKKSGGDASASAAAFEIFGRGQVRMVGALKQGGDAIRDSMAQIKVASDEALSSIDRFGDGVTKTKNELLSFATEGFASVLSFAASAAKGIEGYGASIEMILPAQLRLLKAMQQMREAEVGSRINPGEVAGDGMTPLAVGNIKGAARGAMMGPSKEAIKNARDLAAVEQRMADRWAQFQFDQLEGEAKLQAMREQSDKIAARLLNAQDDQKAALTEQLGLMDMAIAKERQRQQEVEKTSRLTRMQQHLQNLQNRRSQLMDEQLEDELATPDERREKRRQQRRVDRAKERIRRNDEARDRDERTRTTRPGSNQQAATLADMQGQIDRLIAAIEGLVAK